MIGLFGLFVDRGMGPPIAVEFAWLNSIKANKNDDGFYYFSKRPSKRLQVVTKIKESLSSWKETFTPEVQVKGTFGRAHK